MTKIPSVEEYSKVYEERSFERMSELAKRLVERNETQRLALLTELREWSDKNKWDITRDVTVIRLSDLQAHLDELIKSTSV